MTNNNSNLNTSTIVFLVLAAAAFGVLFSIAYLRGYSDDDDHDHEDPKTGLYYRLITPEDFVVPRDSSGKPLPAISGENHAISVGPIKKETISVEVPSDSSVEYKAIMEQGDSLTYAWTVAGGEVYYDYHAHRLNDESGFWTRYVEGTGSESSGSMLAPYAGQHGWYWRNKGKSPVTVTLTVAGFYTELVQIHFQ